jgi:hypothetical protein
LQPTKGPLRRVFLYPYSLPYSQEVGMTIENSTLNDSAALPSSDIGYSGASGDGNDPSMAALKAGFAKLPDPETPANYLPQNANDGENYVGSPFERGGFLTRPQGWER